MHSLVSWTIDEVAAFAVLCGEPCYAHTCVLDKSKRQTSPALMTLDCIMLRLHMLTDGLCCLACGDMQLQQDLYLWLAWEYAGCCCDALQVGRVVQRCQSSGIFNCFLNLWCD